MTIEGVLTGEGVECPVVRTEEGKLYTLSGSVPDTLSIGDAVIVAGHIATVSFCMQGTTLVIESIALSDGAR